MYPKLRAAVTTAGLCAASMLSAGIAEANDGAISRDELYRIIEWQSRPDPYARLTPIQLGLRGAGETPTAVTDAIWVGLGANNDWLNAANWSTNLVPDGLMSAARFVGISGGPIVNLGNASITLSVLEMSDPLYSAVIGGTINLTSTATIDADGVSFELPSTLFTFPSIATSSTTAANNIGGSGSFATAIVGSLGLNKSGDTHIQIDSPQFYTGTTTISGGGKIISTVGDSAFGEAGNAIVLNNGTIQIGSINWSTSRNITIGPNGGNIFWMGSARSVTFSGNISGTGSLGLNGLFGNTAPATFTTGQAFAGTLNVNGGTVVLSGDGAFASAPVIRNAGTLILRNTGSSINRLHDTADLTLRGAALSVINAGSNYVESIGSTTLDGGVSFVSVIPGGNGTQLNLGTLTRNNHAGVVFRGAGLGQSPGGNRSNIRLANGTSLLVNGIIPFAWGNGSFGAFSAVETTQNVLVGYGVNGVTPIQSYNSDFIGSTNATNVRLSGDASLFGTANVNALVLAAPDDFETGMGNAAITLGGSGTLHVDSGAILSAMAGWNDFFSGIPNVFPGNQIDVNLDFGSREAVIMTPSALRINGAISGSGGLTKLGGRTALFAGASSYTGTTTLNGLNRFIGNVLPNTNGPFGNSATPVVLYGGTVSPINPVDQSDAGSGAAHLGGMNNGSSLFARPIEARGTTVLLRNFGAGTLVWGGDINVADPDTILTFSNAPFNAHMVVNGVISGPGRVENHLSTFTDLMNANTFTGGFVLDGTVGVGHDQALSSGSVNVVSTSTATLVGLNGPRTIANPFVIYSGTASSGGTFTIGGMNPIDLTGTINGRGGDYPLNVTNAATTTFSGTLTGGGLIKSGMGTLVLSGNNAFHGRLTIGNGTNSGGMVILRHNNAAGAISGITLVNNGSNTLALDGLNAPGGALTIPAETLFIAGDGISGAGGLRNLSGNNVWNGVVRPLATYDVGGAVASQRATIGVDAGTLTLASTVLVSDPGVFVDGALQFNAHSIGLRKTGPGTLVVGSSVISSNVGSISSQWNGSIVATGSLDIQQGVLQLKPNSGIGTIANGVTLADIGSLSIAGGSASPTATLDITTNAVVIDYTGDSPLADILQYIRSGRAGGTWLGNGITSSSAAADPTRRAIGYAEASDLNTSFFRGNPVDSTSILLRYTFLGDADLDGDVDGIDVGLWAQNFTGELGGAGTMRWTDGDWDYDGDVDGIDVGLWAQNFTGELGMGLSSITITTPISAEAAAILSGLGINVIPEPAGLLVVSLAAGLLRRRTRR